jgi:hypothetical protein
MSILDNVITAIFSPPRKIGAIAIQCAIEESHYDELVITDHPVEQGAEISDHAFKRPAEVVIRAGWSNSGIRSIITELSQAASLLSNAALNFSGSTSPFNYADEVYQQLLTLQASRQPFQIITGKRSYSNMLIRALSVNTDEKTAHSLICTAVCRQVIITQTQAVTFTPMENLASPQKTAQTENAGVKQLTTGSPSPGGSSPPFGNSFSLGWGIN